MPHLEAPTNLGDSSPEASISAELTPPIVRHSPAALAQLQPLRSPEIILNDVRPASGHIIGGAQLQLHNNRRNRLIRLPSFDREIAEIEEEQRNFPTPAVHLLPPALPVQTQEPTLDELLVCLCIINNYIKFSKNVCLYLQRRVTERSDIQNVESVRLRVISYTLSLSRLSLFMPRLQNLDLSGSVLSSLRDLGFGLNFLTHLNVSNCGLNSFDGTGGFPSLRVLIADGNMIQRVGALADLPLLQRLSVRHNRISELGNLSFLGMCANLIEVELEGNPVCHLPLFQQTLRRSVPSLQLLDGRALHENGNNNHNELNAAAQAPSHASTDAELSSLSSDANSDCTSSSTEARVAAKNALNRPATAPASDAGIIVRLQNAERPNSSGK